MDNADDVLTAIQQQRTLLEQDVIMKRAALEEAEARLSAFRANALSALGAASGSKSAQKQRAERQAVVAQLLGEGLSRAEIVRRTGLVDHLVGYDIDCIRRRRKKQGQKKVFATQPGGVQVFATPPGIAAGVPAASAPEEVEAEAESEDDVESIVEVESEEEAESDDEDLETASESEDRDLPEAPAAPIPDRRSKPDMVEPRRPGVVPPGAAASREQLKALAKSIQREGGKTCRLVTTVDYSHWHVIVLDLMGDGETAKDDTGHKHRACRFEMLESDHLHGITLKQAQK